MPDALLGQLSAKLGGLLLKALLVMLRALLQILLQRRVGAFSLGGHLLGKLHEFVTSRPVARLARSLAHGFVAVLIGCFGVLTERRLLLSELGHCERVIEIERHAVWELNGVISLKLV